MGSNEQLRSQVSLVPERTASSQAFVGSGQTGEQSPSQSSSPSTTPLPQLAEQSPSSKLLQPGAQQPSTSKLHSMIGTKTHSALQASAVPISVSLVQRSTSSQLEGQPPAASGSHVSFSSKTPSPQLSEQSLSVLGSQPAAQQLSSLKQLVIGTGTHWASHAPALPISVSGTQALSLTQDTGQLPSHSSSPSTTPLPHAGSAGSQSESLKLVQSLGQHPSPS